MYRRETKWSILNLNEGNVLLFTENIVAKTNYALSSATRTRPENDHKNINVRRLWFPPLNPQPNWKPTEVPAKEINSIKNRVHPKKWIGTYVFKDDETSSDFDSKKKKFWNYYVPFLTFLLLF